jgi:DNA-binding CsgD family transcriptional regulator
VNLWQPTVHPKVVPMGNLPGSGGPGDGSGQGQAARSFADGRAPLHRQAMGLAPGAWPFVDRDGRLRSVLALVGGAAAGAAVLSGPQGSGRTRLTQEAAAQLRADGRRVEWVTGTRGAVATPLGALSHVLPALRAGADPATAWQALVRSLEPTSPGHRPVLCIDDAHLLDDASAALVHKVVLTELADVVVTLLLGAPSPDMVQALWRDGLAVRLDLHRLTDEHVERLLAAALGGPIASRTVRQLWRNSHGSAVLLRELVDAGRETGVLRDEDGLWRWTGELVWTDRLAEVVRVEIGELTDEDRAALELLALGGFVGLDDLVGLTSAAVVGGLERRGLVVVEGAGRRRAARLAEPLHAQALCAQLPESVASAYRAQLAATGSVQRWAREDPLRIGALLLQLDQPPRNADVLTRAAVQSNVSSDHGTAEDLARAAIEEGCRPEAWVALAEALRWQGRPDEADGACAQAVRLPLPPRVHEDLATTWALNLFYGLGRPTDALRMAGAADPATGHGGEVLAVVARMLRLAAAGSIEDVDLIHDARVSQTADPSVEMLRSVLRTTALALRGRTDDALASAARGWRQLRLCAEGTESVSARSALLIGELMALELGGRIPEAVARAAQLHAETMSRPLSALDALAALGRGSTTLAAGRVREARRWLDEAAIGLSECDPLGFLPLARARQAQARALLGDLEAAATALDMARAHPSVRVHEPEALLAEAWCAALAGRDRAASAAAAGAAESASGMGQLAVEARALDACARLGMAGRVARRLDELAGELGGRLLAAYAAHADAAALHRADALEEVAAEFSDLGALALAADTYGRAAEAHRQVGHRRRAAAAGSRSSGLARAAGGLRTPTLDRLAPYALTSREREIAQLAAEGIANRTIARRLVLSVRTIETHLAHAYDKLGINSRASLMAALAQEAEPLTTPEPSVFAPFEHRPHGGA